MGEKYTDITLVVNERGVPTYSIPTSPGGYWESVLMTFPSNLTCLDRGCSISFPTQIGKYTSENTKITRAVLRLYAASGQCLSKGISSVTSRVFPTAGNEYGEKQINQVRLNGVGWFEIPIFILDNTITGLSVSTDTDKYGVKGRDSFGNVCYTVNDYTKTGLLVYTHESQYPPMLRLYWSYNPPVKPNNLAPNNTTINPKTAIRFTWNSEINQKAYQLQYKINGGSWQTISKTSIERYCELLPGTISESTGTVDWRVRVSEYEDTYSDWVSASFSLGAVAQPLPQLIRPVGDYIYDKNIALEWQFISSTTEEQQGYDIEVNDGSGYKRIGYSETSKNQSYNYVISSNEESKIIYWRLRVRNQFGEWSDWTEGASFQVVGKPPAPQIIEVENNNRPLIKWTAKDQEMYEINIYNADKEIVYQSGEVLESTNKKHKLTKDLANGKYFIHLKIKNIYGIESPEVVYTHIISPVPIQKPKINIYNSYYCVIIKSDYKKGFVYRDGNMIGELIDGVYEDYTGANLKLYNYKIRAYENDVYGDSDEVSGRCFFEFNNTIAPYNNPKDFRLISWNLDSMPNKKVDYSLQSASIRLESLKFPFIEYSEQANEVTNLTTFISTKEEIFELYKLIDLKTELIYRDTRGNILIGAVLGINYEHNIFGYTVNLSIIRTSDRYE